MSVIVRIMVMLKVYLCSIELEIVLDGAQQLPEACSTFESDLWHDSMRLNI